MTEFAVPPPARPPSEWGVYGPQARKFTGKHVEMTPPVVLYFRGSKHNDILAERSSLRSELLRTPEKYLAVIDMSSDNPLDWVAVALDRGSTRLSPTATLRQWIRSHANPRERRKLGERVSYWPNGINPERWHLHTAEEQDRDVLWSYCHVLMYSDIARRSVGFVPFPSVDPTEPATFTKLSVARRTVDLQGLGKAWQSFYRDSGAASAIRDCWSRQLPRIVAGYRWRRCVMEAGDIAIDIYDRFMPPETPTEVPELTPADFPPKIIKKILKKRPSIPVFSIEPAYNQITDLFFKHLGRDVNGRLVLHKTETGDMFDAWLLNPATVLFGMRRKLSVEPEGVEVATVLTRARIVTFIDKYFAKQVMELAGVSDEIWESIKTWVYTALIEIYLKRTAGALRWTIYTRSRARSFTLAPPVTFHTFSYSVQNMSGEIFRCQFTLFDRYCDPDHVVTCDIDVDTLSAYCAKVGKFRKMNMPTYSEPIGPGVGLAGTPLDSYKRCGDFVRREPGDPVAMKFVLESNFWEHAFSNERGKVIGGGERKRKV